MASRAAKIRFAEAFGPLPKIKPRSLSNRQVRSINRRLMLAGRGAVRRRAQIERRMAATLISYLEREYTRLFRDMRSKGLWEPIERLAVDIYMGARTPGMSDREVQARIARHTRNNKQLDRVIISLLKQADPDDLRFSEWDELIAGGDILLAENGAATISAIWQPIAVVAKKALDDIADGSGDSDLINLAFTDQQELSAGDKTPELFTSLKERQNMIKINGTQISDEFFDELKDSIKADLIDNMKGGIGAAGIARNLRKKLEANYGKPLPKHLKHKPLLWARTEGVIVQSDATMTRGKEIGLDGKTWFAVNDERTRPDHALNSGDGVIPMDEQFSDGSMDAGSGNLSPFNCRCATTPAILPNGKYTANGKIDITNFSPKKQTKPNVPGLKKKKPKTKKKPKKPKLPKTLKPKATKQKPAATNKKPEKLPAKPKPQPIPSAPPAQFVDDVDVFYEVKTQTQLSNWMDKTASQLDFADDFKLLPDSLQQDMLKLLQASKDPRAKEALAAIKKQLPNLFPKAAPPKLSFDPKVVVNNPNPSQFKTNMKGLALFDDETILAAYEQLGPKGVTDMLNRMSQIAFASKEEAAKFSQQVMSKLSNLAGQYLKKNPLPPLKVKPKIAPTKAPKKTKPKPSKQTKIKKPKAKKPKVKQTTKKKPTKAKPKNPPHKLEGTAARVFENPQVAFLKGEGATNLRAMELLLKQPNGSRLYTQALDKLTVKQLEEALERVINAFTEFSPGLAATQTRVQPLIRIAIEKKGGRKIPKAKPGQASPKNRDKPNVPAGKQVSPFDPTKAGRSPYRVEVEEMARAMSPARLKEIKKKGLSNEAKFLTDDGASLPAPNTGPAGFNSTEVVEAKKTIAREIAKRTKLEESDVATLVSQWAITSNDNSYASLRVQKMIADEFGGQMTTWQRQKLAKLEKAREHYLKTGEMLDVNRDQLLDVFEMQRDFSSGGGLQGKIGETKSLAVQNLYGGDKDAALRDFIRAQYDYTQEYFKKHGIKKLKVYRGIEGGDLADMLDDALDSTVGYIGNAAESYSISPSVAEGFGSTGLAMEVPVERILGSCRTGFGCLNEQELVVMFGDKWDDLVRSIEF